MVAPKPKKPKPSEQQRASFGKELVDFAQRAAVHAVAPHLQELERQNADLHARLARETKNAILIRRSKARGYRGGRSIAARGG
jgi:hypothetical protein